MHVPVSRFTPCRIGATNSIALRTCAALTLAAGLLFTAAPAPAAAVPATERGACASPGTASADKAVADRLRPSMNGKRLGRAVSGQSIACARAIIHEVQVRRLPQRAAVIAVTTAIAESTLHNHPVATDHDSLGLFQQRPSMGWGRPDQITDPAYATSAFLDAMLRKYPNDAWMSGDIGQICQKVQRSAFPAAYAPEAHDAQLIVGALWQVVAKPVTPAVRPVTPPKTPDGPFQKKLITAYTALNPTDKQHRLLPTDWDADGRMDLAVVQGAGTGSGSTEVHVLEGESGFQALMVDATTALGATDERHAFSFADWNADGKPDLVDVQRSGTASGRTEVRIADGASNFQSITLQAPTVLPATDQRHVFAAADWNGDGRPDLVVVQKSASPAARTEVRVLDGASNFQRELTPAPFLLAPTSAHHEVFVGDWNNDRKPDVAVVQKSGAADKQVGVQIFDGASNLSKPLLRTSAAHAPMDDRYEMAFADWSGDARLDLVVLQKSGNVSGRTDMSVLGG
jgi:hypothetical protein